MTMSNHLHTLMRQHSRHSEWANARLYEACNALDDDTYRSPTGSASLHALLNRLLMHDRITLSQLNGYDIEVTSIDEELHGNRSELLDALVAEDIALVERVREMDDDGLFRPISYTDIDGNRHTNSQLELITGLLERQARLRGAIAERLTELGNPVPDIDVITFLREAC